MGIVTHVVILNYRTPADTIRAVQAVQRSDGPPPRVIVVDNASGDDSLERFARELPGVQVIAAPTNAGFSSGANVGIRAALREGAARVWLLNSDATVAPDTLGILERALAADTTLGIVAPAVLTAGGDRVESLGIRYAPQTGRMKHIGSGQAWRKDTGRAIADVDGVSGCAMLVKRSVFERSGFFADEFFFGYEDLDFCLRARRDGYRTACVAVATVVHEGHKTIGRTSARRIYFGVRNHLLLGKRAGTTGTSGATGTTGTRNELTLVRLSRRFLVVRLAARSLQTMSILALNLGHVLVTSDVPRAAGLRAYARGVRDYARGKFHGGG